MLPAAESPSSRMRAGDAASWSVQSRGAEHRQSGNADLGGDLLNGGALPKPIEFYTAIEPTEHRGKGSGWALDSFCHCACTKAARAKDPKLKFSASSIKSPTSP